MQKVHVQVCTHSEDYGIKIYTDLKQAAKKRVQYWDGLKNGDCGIKNNMLYIYGSTDNVNNVV